MGLLNPRRAKPELSEEALIAAAQGGDVSAFNRLVLSYQDMAYNAAYRILGDPDGAMDATQEAFLNGYRALPSYRGGSFKAWLLRIVTNCCYDQMRARQRRPSTPLDDLIEDDEHSALLTDGAESPEARLERLDLDEAIQQALRTLPEDQRIAVIMSDIEGLSYEEIAAATAANLGTVKSRLSRGRSRLRDYILEHKELIPLAARL